MTDKIVLSGDLTEIRFPTLLMSLYRERETGILTLSSQVSRKSLYIEEGKIIFATSDDPDDRLGECLLRRNMITAQHYLDSVEQIRPGRRQGEILVDMGALTTEELVEGLSQQLYDIIFSVFRLKSGTYMLTLTDFSTLEMVTLSVDMPLVVFKGMERLETWSQIYPVVGPPSTRLHTAWTLPSFVAELDLTPDQEHVLSLCKSGMAVASLLEASYLPQYQTYRLLWIFLTLGLLEREGASAEPSAPPDAAHAESLLEQYNDLYELIHRSLSQHPAGTEALARILEETRASHPGLSGGQEDLLAYGRLDIDKVLWDLRAFPEAERMPRLQAFLEELLYAMMLVVDQILPQEERAAIRAYIQKQAQPGAGS
jgi:hypothetical protein